MENRNDAQAIIEAVERLEELELIPLQGDETVAVIPNGKGLHSLKKYRDEYRLRPERKEGNTILTTLMDFNAFVQRHMTGDSAVFCDDTNKASPRLVAVFDAHSQTEPNWQKHRASYSFPLSDEWVKWSKVPEWFGQAEFAAFLEDRIADVIDPAGAGALAKEFAEMVGAQLATPAKMLQLSRGLEVSVDAKVVNKINLSSGEGELTWKEENKDENGQALKVPGAFCIAIPVFRLGVAYKIPVRIRYRVKEGKVLWNLALQRVDRVFEDAIAESAQSVREVTSLPVFRGKPD